MDSDSRHCQPVSDSGNPPEAGWREFAIGLALLLLATFPTVLMGGQTFIFRDFGYFGFPLASYLHDSFWLGEIPLWNPLNYSGHPFLAQWNTQALYPGSLIYVLMSPAWALGLFCILHQWLGGVGMFLLAQRWTSRFWAGAIAGVGFAFNGLVMNSLDWPNNIAALGWMPWVVLALERAMSGGARAWLAAAGIGLLQMLTGAPEVILLTWALGGTLAVFGNGMRGAVTAIMKIGLLAITVALAAAAQLLPFLKLLSLSHRDSGFGDDRWSAPLTGLGNFLVPLLHTHLGFHGVYMQHGQYWTTSYYAGVPVLALAIWGAWRARTPRGALLILWTLLGVVMSLGSSTPLHPFLLKVFPPLGFMRFPVKFMLIAAFTLPLLAAYGMGRFMDVCAAKSPNGNRGLFATFMACAAGIGVTLVFASASRFPNDDWPATLNNGLMRLGLLLAFGGVMFAALRANELKPRIILLIASVALVWLDLAFHLPRHPTVDQDALTVKMEHTPPVPKHGISRAMITPMAYDELSHSFIPKTADDYMSRRAALFSNCNLLEGIPKLDGFFSLYVREEFQVRSLLYAQTNVFAPALADFLGVAQITSTTNVFEFSPRSTFMPFITGGQQPVFADEDVRLSAMGSSQWNPRQQVFARPTDQSKLAGVGRTTVQILKQEVSTHRIDCEVEAAGAGLVVIAQSNYPEWRATVDGQPTEILTVNHAFQGVRVSQGKHVIRLEYRDSQFRIGCAISAVTILAGLVGWRFSRERSVGA